MCSRFVLPLLLHWPLGGALVFDGTALTDIASEVKLLISVIDVLASCADENLLALAHDT